MEGWAPLIEEFCPLFKHLALFLEEWGQAPRAEVVTGGRAAQLVAFYY